MKRKSFKKTDNRTFKRAANNIARLHTDIQIGTPDVFPNSLIPNSLILKMPFQLEFQILMAENTKTVKIR